MKGDYDALLEWPFRQKVTFQILDQETGRNHLTDSFRPDPNSSSFKRPTSEMNIASGKSSDARHEKTDLKVFVCHTKRRIGGLGPHESFFGYDTDYKILLEILPS